VACVSKREAANNHPIFISLFASVEVISWLLNGFARLYIRNMRQQRSNILFLRMKLDGSGFPDKSPNSLVNFSNSCTPIDRGKILPAQMSVIPKSDSIAVAPFIVVVAPYGKRQRPFPLYLEELVASNHKAVYELEVLVKFFSERDVLAMRWA